MPRSLIILGIAAIFSAPAGGQEKNAKTKSYAKYFIKVEIQGVLAATEKGIVVSAPTAYHGLNSPATMEANKWYLDLSRSTKLEELAKNLNGKTVKITGKALIFNKWPGPPVTCVMNEIQVKSIKVVKGQ